jgi:glycosyltransferase involved in cell wall biosynthesis
VKFSDVRHLPKLVRHIAYYRKLREAGRDADVILALDPVSVGLPAMWAAKKLKKKLVVKIVGDYAWEQGVQRFGVKQTLDTFVRTSQSSFLVRRFQKIQSRVALFATKIIVPSEYLKGIVSSWGIGSEKIQVIYNGISLPQDIRLPDNRPLGFLIVSMGRRVPWKGFEAIERIAREKKDWHVFIAQGMRREEALGWVKAADVFVLNSLYEGLSHALLEAVLLGTPVIATDAGGNAEVVRHKETGILISPGDDQALGRALEEVYENPSLAKERALAGLSRAKKFSHEEMLQNTVALLKTI